MGPSSFAAGHLQSCHALARPCPDLGGALHIIVCWTFARHAASASLPAGSARILLLPRRIVSGERATLAVLDVNGRLTPGVTVNFSNGDRLTTDQTGRALFVAPLNPGVIFGSIAGRRAAWQPQSCCPPNPQLSRWISNLFRALLPSAIASNYRPWILRRCRHQHRNRRAANPPSFCASSATSLWFFLRRIWSRGLLRYKSPAAKIHFRPSR